MPRLLLIGLRYHDYTQAIIDECAHQGYDVAYHEIQPRSLFYKTLRRVAPSLYDRMVDRHHAGILAREAGREYDVVLFIQSHQMSLEHLAQLRARQKRATFILYNWDSITTHDYRDRMRFFDRVFTFDPDDAKALDIGYLPLFCVRAFQNLPTDRVRQDAVYFVGNIVSTARYGVLQAFKRYCASAGVTFDAFMACTPYVMINLLRAGFMPLDVSPTSIDHGKLISMMERASAVFDFANHRQAGYTMRVMENLCAGKKLITSNQRIASEPFYSEDRILVINDSDFSATREFLARALVSPHSVFEQFYIQNFVARLLGG